MLFLSNSFTVSIWMILLNSVSTMESILNCSEEVSSALKKSSVNIHMDSALHQCFKNNPYDTSQMPLIGRKEVEMRYTFDFVNLISLENDGTIVMIADFDLVWTDEYRIWNSSELLDLKVIHIPSREIWTPAVFLANCESESCIIGANNQTCATLYSDGTAELYMQRKKLVATCDLDLSNFPRDSQKCTLTFQVQYQLGGKVSISSYNGSYIKDMVENDEWNFIYIYDAPTNITYWHYYRDEQGRYYLKENDGKSSQFEGFVVEIALERRSQFYETNLIVPVLLISLIGIFANFLSATSGEKINIQVTVLLGFLFLQTITASMIPQSANSPKIALYILYALLISAFNVLYSSILLLGRSKKGRKLPKFLEKVFVQFLGCILRPTKLFAFLMRHLKSRKSEAADQDDHENFEPITNFPNERITAICNINHERPIYFQSFLDVSNPEASQRASNNLRNTNDGGILKSNKELGLKEKKAKQKKRIWKEFIGNLNLLLAFVSITLSALDFWFYFISIFV